MSSRLISNYMNRKKEFVNQAVNKQMKHVIINLIVSIPLQVILFCLLLLYLYKYDVLFELM